MREIKFKVWDKAKKEWFEPVYEAYKGKLHDISISLSGQIIERTIDCCSDIRNNEDFTLLQYTGLKDKNGTDIYEGDIIQRFTGYRFEVKVREYSLGSVNNAKAWGYDIHPDDLIIGNIYQHHELLTLNSIKLSTKNK